jgi:hypothetical protein
MILSKRFECLTDDLDSVVVELAKEIENGWHIGKIEVHDFHICCSVMRDEPDFSIELVRKDRYKI